MAWGKEKFRTKYKESNDCLEKIKDNYYDLDYEYQMISKQLQQKENIIKEVREFIIDNMGYYSDRLEFKEYTERYVKDLNKIMNLLNKGE